MELLAGPPPTQGGGPQSYEGRYRMEKFRCFYCDRVTSNPAKVWMGPNGYLSCAECREADSA